MIRGASFIWNKMSLDAKDFTQAFESHRQGVSLNMGKFSAIFNLPPTITRWLSYDDDDAWTSD
uniref:Uncharacterized protein n=1 Tax=Salix viminalis TaxID=40686 RepID=A0A6N2K5I2_SALVM